MNIVTNKTVRSAFGIAAFTLVLTAGPAAAFTVDPSVLKLVDELVMKVQTKTMNELYPTMPLKDQMRGKMMRERAAGNYLQDVMQPQMMQRNVDALKNKQLERMLNQ